MPILRDLSDHDLFGPIIRKAFEEGRQQGLEEAQERLLKLLRRFLERRFGPLPPWAVENLASRSSDDLLELVGPALEAPTLEAMLR